MKTFFVLPVSIVLVSILFCPMAMAAPTSMPSDLQIVQPDPSLPKELSAFFGKWEWQDGRYENFLVVEKIDEQKASLYVWRSGFKEYPNGWTRQEGNVVKERGRYMIWYRGMRETVEITQKGEHLNMSSPGGLGTGLLRFRRVP